MNVSGAGSSQLSWIKGHEASLLFKKILLFITELTQQ